MVCGVVIDDDDFYVVDVLIYKVGKELIQECFIVINGYYYV